MNSFNLLSEYKKIVIQYNIGERRDAKDLKFTLKIFVVGGVF